MIICYSTSPGNLSIRTEQGSPFITGFCDVVNDNPDCTIYQGKIFINIDESLMPTKIILIMQFFSIRGFDKR